MFPGTVLRVVLSGVVCALLYPPPACAQLPKRLERCLPYPTYAQEIRDMDEEVAAKMRVQASPRIIVDGVKFDGPIHISDSDRQQLVSELKQHDFSVDTDWLDEVQEIWIKVGWRDRGYFKVEVTAKQELVRNDSEGEHVLITVHVDEGLQYRLGDIHFRSSDPDVPLVFSPEELRKLIPLNEGDIFAADKIRMSLNALQRLYGSQGYIDFVAVPFTEFDDSQRRISLVMELDQQKQFRVDKIEAFGSNPAMETFLKSKLKPGGIFTSRFIENFIEENRTVLPPDISSEDFELVRNVKNGTVSVRFNVQTCPQLQN